MALALRLALTEAHLLVHGLCNSALALALRLALTEAHLLVHGLCNSACASATRSLAKVTVPVSFAAARSRALTAQARCASNLKLKSQVESVSLEARHGTVTGQCHGGSGSRVAKLSGREIVT